MFEIYTTSAFVCPYCVGVKELLNVYGFDFFEKDIVNEEYKKEFLEKGFRTVPQVYLEGHHIGGYETTKDYVRNTFFKDYTEEQKQKILEELDKIA